MQEADPLQQLRALMKASIKPRKRIPDEEFTAIISRLIGRARFRYLNVMELHRGLGLMLSMAGLDVHENIGSEEAHFDFLVQLKHPETLNLVLGGPVGIIIAIKGVTDRVDGKMADLAQTGGARSLILITKGPKHRRLDGKRYAGPRVILDEATRYADRGELDPLSIPLTVAKLGWL